jgi:hypothetical protein
MLNNSFCPQGTRPVGRPLQFAPLAAIGRQYGSAGTNRGGPGEGWSSPQSQSRSTGRSGDERSQWSDRNRDTGSYKQGGRGSAGSGRGRGRRGDDTRDRYAAGGRGRPPADATRYPRKSSTDEPSPNQKKVSVQVLFTARSQLAALGHMRRPNLLACISTNSAPACPPEDHDCVWQLELQRRSMPTCPRSAGFPCMHACGHGASHASRLALRMA